MARKDVTDKMVCEAYRMCERDRIEDRYRSIIKFPYDYLQLMSQQPFKVCYRAMERAYEHGLIEYGTSLRSGWLTEKGRELLDA